MDLRKFIPSMFHRRVLLLGSACVALLGLCFAKACHLTLVEGPSLRAKAEQALDRREFLPTTRGVILDRRGRKIAIDQASYDLAVEYKVITGEWAVEQAKARARRANADSWNTLSADEQSDLVEPYIAEFREVEQRIWKTIRQLGNLDQVEIDNRCNQIKTVVERRASYLWEQQRKREVEQYGSLRDDFRPMRIAEREQAHVILTRIGDDVAFEMMALSRELPGMIRVQDSHRRHHPWTTRTYTIDRRSLPRDLRSDRPLTVEVRGVADHILGSVRDEVWAEDIERRPFYDEVTGEIDLKGYRVGDSVGHSGLERTFEDQLRGARGMVTERKDTGVRNRLEPQSGDDLQLALDIELQGRIQAVLDPDLGLTRVQSWHNNHRLPLGWKLNAAAVVMDVETGEILALVSTPSITDGLDMSDRMQAQNQPRVNRAVEAIYPPGSIVKPLVLIAAVSDGAHDLEVPITCNGQFYEQHDNFARCWIFREQFGWQSHGPLRASEAIGRSCNIYFYHMADKLGIDRLKAWLHWFGMGRLLDIGLTRELQTENPATGELKTHTVGGSPGILPSEHRIAQMASSGSLRSGTIFMGIGQGPIAWTPLHAANAYAMLARGGEVHTPTLVRGFERDQIAPASRMLPGDLIHATLEGLRQSAEEQHGTGNHLSYADDLTQESIINAPGVTVWAKTGTAQAPKLPADVNGDGEITEVRDDNGTLTDIEGIPGLDHAWYVGLVGPKGADRPTIAISVLVEYGGSGGRCAGPVANQIIRALQIEGYLPGRELWDDVDFDGP